MTFTRTIVLCSWILSAAAVPADAVPAPDQAEPRGQFCIDGMETVPYTDDSDVVPISDITDGGCQSPQDTIAI